MTRPPGDSGAVRAGLAAAAALLVLPVLLIAAAAGIATQQAAACTAQPAPTPLAATTIPARYLIPYQQAGQEYGIAWEILADIGEVESDNGQSGAPGVHSGANSAGAAGPMQFGIGGAAGNTWGGAPVHPASEQTGGYGIDGDHDGVVDVYDPGDAIPSAARYPVLHGAPADIQAALFDWNHSQAYVTLVLAWSARYAAGGDQAVAAATGPACTQTAVRPLPPGTPGG
jgi:peptidoglycan DL-endopeptidase CwlO